MPRMYVVPNDYYYRIHHIRPRFKRDVENVLIFMATEISSIPKSNKSEFMQNVNRAIRRFPGNAAKTPKTINNWRTEISSLFGLIVYNKTSNTYESGYVSKRLANNQDLVEFFKYFLFLFQYPGGHLRLDEIQSFIENGIKFKPAPYILSLLKYGGEREDRNFGINKAEATHCIFNDLRVTRDQRPVSEVYELIRSNRDSGLNYDWEPQITRYAKDVLDYMVLADLVKLMPASKVVSVKKVL